MHAHGWLLCQAASHLYDLTSFQITYIMAVQHGVVLLQVDNWLNQRPFQAPAESAPQAHGPVIVIGAGPAGLAAAHHLKVTCKDNNTSVLVIACSDRPMLSGYAPRQTPLLHAL